MEALAGFLNMFPIDTSGSSVTLSLFLIFLGLLYWWEHIFNDTGLSMMLWLLSVMQPATNINDSTFLQFNTLFKIWMTLVCQQIESLFAKFSHITECGGSLKNTRKYFKSAQKLNNTILDVHSSLLHLKPARQNMFNEALENIWAKDFIHKYVFPCLLGTPFILSQCFLDVA